MKVRCIGAGYPLVYGDLYEAKQHPTISDYYEIDGIGGLGWAKSRFEVVSEAIDPSKFALCKWSDVKEGTRLICIDQYSTWYGEACIVMEREPLGASIKRDANGTVSFWGEARIIKSFSIHPDDAEPETKRSPTTKTSPDQEYIEKQYQFFATCFAPGCCPRCSAPLPCKYH